MIAAPPYCPEVLMGGLSPPSTVKAPHGSILMWLSSSGWRSGNNRRSNRLMRPRRGALAPNGPLGRRGPDGKLHDLCRDLVLAQASIGPNELCELVSHIAASGDHSLHARFVFGGVGLHHRSTEIRIHILIGELGKELLGARSRSVGSRSGGRESG